MRTLEDYGRTFFGENFVNFEKVDESKGYITYIDYTGVEYKDLCSIEEGKINVLATEKYYECDDDCVNCLLAEPIYNNDDIIVNYNCRYKK